MKVYKFILLTTLFAFRIECQNTQFALTYDNYWEDVGTAVGVDDQNNIYVSGQSEYITGGTSPVIYNMLYKFNPSGTLLWKDTINTTPFKSLTDMSGNTYIIGGPVLMKYNSAGQLLWQSTFPGKQFVNAALNYTGFVASGFTTGNNVSVVTQFDQNGSVLWQRIGDFPCSGPAPIACDQNNNTHIVFVANGAKGVMKINNTGSITSTFTIADQPLRLAIGNDLTVYLSGSTATNFFIRKYSPTGNLIWSDSLSSNFMGIKDMIFDNSNLIICGFFAQSFAFNSQSVTSNGDQMYVISISASGGANWIQTSTGNTSGGSVTPFAIAYTTQNNIIITGNMNGTKTFSNTILSTTSGYNDLLLVTLMDNQLATTIQEKKKEINEITLFPNPTSGLTQVNGVGEKLKVVIYNALGQQMKFISIDNNPTKSVTIDLSFFERGIYFLEIQSENTKVVKKVVLQ